MLPAETYVKGFLRTYAEYLGLDGQLYVDEYNSRFVIGEEQSEAALDAPRRARSARNRRIETNVVLVALAAIAILTVIVISAWKASGGKPPAGSERQAPVTHTGARAAPARGHGAARRRRTSPRGSATRAATSRTTARSRRATPALDSRPALWLADRLAGEPALQSPRQARPCAGRQAEGDHRHAHRLAPRVAASLLCDRRVGLGARARRPARSQRAVPRGVPASARRRPGAHHDRRRRPGRSRSGAA